MTDAVPILSALFGLFLWPGALTPEAVFGALFGFGCIGISVPLAFLMRRHAFGDRVTRMHESHYQLAVENSNDGVWLTDTSARTTFINARMIEMLGSPAREIIGVPIFSFMDAATDAAVRERFMVGIDYRPASFSNVSLRRKDGGRLWTDISVTPLHDSEGRAIGTLCGFVGVTPQRPRVRELGADNLDDSPLGPSSTCHDRAPTPVDVAAVSGGDLEGVLAAFGNSEARCAALIDAIPQLLLIVDGNANVEYANKRWADFSGIDLTRIPGIESIVHPDDRGLFDSAREATHKEHECELRLRRRDGVYRWHLCSAVALETTAYHAKKWIVTATDVQARKSAEAELADSAATLAHHADHDALTNLPNREKLSGRLAEMITEAQRDGTLVVVMYLDIDHFKTVNDTLGHNAGDQILIETSTRIRASLRSDDTASRFGGDEFVIACRADDIVDAARIAERVQTAVRVPIALEGKRLIVASSIGISLFPHDGNQCADLVQKADAAMYAAKQNGRNAWNFYSPETHVPAVAALEMEVELREAIAQKQFVVHYQPMIDVGSGRVMGAEALVRWAHPARGLLPPGEFIAFAEEHGLIAPIGEIVLHATCAQLRRMRLRPSDNFSIAVNVSARQFTKPGFIGTIASAIAEHQIDARRLEIEITESVVMGDLDSVVATLTQLEELGVRISLDDFGTGYSSLAYIKNFPIHTLKIDRSFVTDIASNFTDQAIAKTIITLAHSLGMRTIAEGVENEGQLDRLRSFGADCFQGFLVSRPVPAPEFEQLLASRASLRVTIG